MKQRSACVRVVAPSGQVLCVSRKDGRGWCLPGGKVEERETVLFGAQRELYEETGLSVGWDLLQHVYTGAYQGPSGLRDVTCFEVASTVLPPFTLDMSPEGLDMVWLEWDELVRQSPFGAFYGRCGAPTKLKKKYSLIWLHELIEAAKIWRATLPPEDVKHLHPTLRNVADAIDGYQQATEDEVRAKKGSG